MTPINIALALAPVVPEIVRWITGGDEKAADTAQKVVDVAEAVTGMKGMEAAQAIRANPELMVSFRTRVLELDAQLEMEYLRDRQNARGRDVELAKSGHSNRRADVLAFLAVGALVFCVWLVGTQLQLPQAAREAIMFIAGVFAAAVRDVYSFEFGSSRGSKEKGEQQAEVMAELAKKLRN